MHTNQVETDGDDAAQGLHAVTDHRVVSGPPPGGFEQIGEAVHAVVMRLQTRLPRVKVLSRIGGEGDNPGEL